MQRASYARDLGTAVAILVLLSSCKTQEPERAPFVVTISQSATVQGATAVENGQTVYACNYSITGSATGGASGDFAEWVSATLNWRLTSNGQQATTQLTRTNLIEWFGSERINSTPRTASRRAWWSGPFTLHHELRFTMPDGEQRSADFFLTCQ